MIRKAAARGVGLEGLAAHRSAPGGSAPALVLGFAGLSEAAIEDGIRALAL